MDLLVPFIVFCILFFIWFVQIYNKLIRMIEAVRNDQRQIDIQLDRRHKVFDSLINVVNKYMDYEKTTLKDVVALRSKAQKAQKSGDQTARIASEEQLSKIASGINIAFENYPDLKANQNVMQLQEEIVNTENKLSFSKQSLNDGIERYNAYKNMLFQSAVVALLSGKLDQHFPYWRISEEEAKNQEDYTVKL